MGKETFRVAGITEAPERGKVPLSPVVRAGPFVFVSGMPPIDRATGEIESADIPRQMELVLDNVKARLEAAGTSLDKVVKCTLFISNAAYFDKVNEVYRRAFPHEAPARTFVAVGSWPWAFDIELECIAIA